MVVIRFFNRKLKLWLFYKMLLYILPFVVFLVMCAIISNVNRKEESLTFNVKSIIPALAVSILVFFGIKYREQSHEPMMPGNYFE